MVPPKRFEYAASVDRQGRILAENGAPVELDDVWLPEHLVLAAVARCTLAALRHHARGATVTASARANGAVTRRGEDGKYAIVELDVAFDVEIDPQPDALAELLAKAERDCFVGNSLTVRPVYAWRVNGEPLNVMEVAG